MAGTPSHLRRRIQTTLLGLACLLCALCTSALASTANPGRPDPIALTTDTQSVPLGLHLSLLEDASGTLRIDDLLSTPDAHSFRPSTKVSPGFGFSRSAFWARAVINNTTDMDALWLLDLAYAPLQHIDVFLVEQNQVVARLQGGGGLPVQERPFVHRTHVFPLHFKPGVSSSLFVRIAGESSLSFPLTLWRSDAFAKMASTQMYILGAYVGVMVALMLYNAFIFFMVREPVYGFYIGFMFFFMLFSMSINGTGQQYLWPGNEFFARISIPFFIGAGGIFASLFTYRYLEGQNQQAWMRNTFKAGITLAFAVFVASLLLPYKIAIIMSVASVGFWTLSWIGCSAILTRRGQHSARYYLAAWLTLLSGAFLFVLKTIGILPTNMLTEYSMQIGSAMEAIILSVALAARMRALREENARAQKRILEQEKMANLGLLSAGVSHEINNPNNFLSVSAQTLEARLQDFRRELEELAEGDEDANALFKRRFEDFDKQLGLIKQGSDRIKGIVKSMRAASRNDEKQEKGLIDPVDTLRNTVELVKPTYRDHIAFDTTGLGSNIQIEGYSSQLAQVFTNLLVNACHAIEERRGRDRQHEGLITLRSEPENDRILIHVSDNGCGMTEETQKRLFEPFFTTKGADKGTGLGMGICRGIIERHGGQLRIKSAAGEGTTMTLALPVHA